MAVRTPHSPIK